MDSEHVGNTRTVVQCSRCINCHACKELNEAVSKARKREATDKSVRRNREKNSKTREEALNYWTRWEPWEEEVAADLSLSNAEVAKQIGRTIYGVRSYRRRTGQR